MQINDLFENSSIPNSFKRNNHTWDVIRIWDTNSIRVKAIFAITQARGKTVSMLFGYNDNIGFFPIDWFGQYSSPEIRQFRKDFHKQ